MYVFFKKRKIQVQVCYFKHTKGIFCLNDIDSIACIRTHFVLLLLAYIDILECCLYC